MGNGDAECRMERAAEEGAAVGRCFMAGVWERTCQAYVYMRQLLFLILTIQFLKIRRSRLVLERSRWCLRARLGAGSRFWSLVVRIHDGGPMKNGNWVSGKVIVCSLVCAFIVVGVPAWATEDPSATGGSGEGATPVVPSVAPETAVGVDEQVSAVPAADSSAATVEQTEQDEREARRSERREQRGERRDARSEIFLPSRVNPAFAALDANNPFATEAYEVRWNPSGVEAVDGFIESVARLQGTLALARYVADQMSVTEPSPEMIQMGTTLVQLLATVPAEATNLVNEGTNLATNLPNILAGPALLRIGQITTGVRDSVTYLGHTVSDIPETVRSFGEVFGRRNRGAAEGRGQ